MARNILFNHGAHVLQLFQVTFQFLGLLLVTFFDVVVFAVGIQDFINDIQVEQSRLFLFLYFLKTLFDFEEFKYITDVFVFDVDFPTVVGDKVFNI